MDPNDKGKRKWDQDELLSGSVRSASYNIVFQVLTRVFTFLLNSFILRYVSHDVLGICNVRLALLYSSILFLSREPFRRAFLRKSDGDSWEQTINLVWLSVPVTGAWSLIFGFIWTSVLSQPGIEGSDLRAGYQWSVWVICLGSLIDSFTEVPYIVGQYFLFYRLRIICDTTLIILRSGFLAYAVVYTPENAIQFYAIGSCFGEAIVAGIYYGFFHFTLRSAKGLPFKSLRDFAPNFNRMFGVPRALSSLVWSFFKQGILKQILTEGERYLMTFFDILSFNEQGVYDLVSNLGSLAARFLFLPIEESAYFFFAQTLQKKSSFKESEKEEARNCAHVLGTLVRLMLMIGLIMLVYGIPYSNTVLYLYGGEGLSGGDSPGTRLLQANCAYIFVMALNGVTEAFTFAAMSQDQLDRFNQKLVLFSGIFLLGSYLLTRMFGSVGFFIANALNMSLRIGHSCFLIQRVFHSSGINPFKEWEPNSKVLGAFALSVIGVNLPLLMFGSGRLLHVGIGLIIFGLNMGTLVLNDKELFRFFIRLYKSKSS